MLVYDIEIVRGIPPKQPSIVQTCYEYCRGWDDHANMGISVIGAYDYDSGRYRVFCRDNFDQFAELAWEHELLIGFNNIKFDNAVLQTRLQLPKEVNRYYDVLREIWKAAALGPDFQYPSHAGYGLDAVCRANGLGEKTGHGSQAPLDWQDGQIGSVIDYCLGDVRLTTLLFNMALDGEPIISPKNGEKLILRNPDQVQ